MRKIEIKVSSSSRNQMIEITGDVRKTVSDSGVKDGIMIVYTPHTTSAITVNENADPDVYKDMTGFMNRLVPEDTSFRHMEGNSDSHIKSSLFGCSEHFIIEDAQIQLGTWQGIYFCEFDGPRTRKVWVKIISG